MTSSIEKVLLSIAFIKFFILLVSGSGKSRRKTQDSNGVNSKPMSCPHCPTAILPYPSFTALRKFSLVMLATTAPSGETFISSAIVRTKSCIARFPVKSSVCCIL